MAIGTGHRSNNYSESKMNDHLDNNRRQEQRNKGIPNKSHPNFREEHKSFSSIFVSNIPWNASSRSLGYIVNKWSVVIDVYMLQKEIPKSYVVTYNRPVERSGDGVTPIVPGNKSVDMSGKYGTSYAGAESVGVSDCNKCWMKDDVLDRPVGSPLVIWAPKGLHEKDLEDDAGEIHGVHSQGDCGNVTTDDNEEFLPAIETLNEITRVVTLSAQLRSWKDYFPSDLQIWSYYGNVKEVILLHNALSRQTKDAG
ncbi:hypothetical protein Tco_0363902 [Tanacetum coccineum]